MPMNNVAIGLTIPASYTRLQGVGSDVVYDYLMPPLQPQPVIVAVLDSVDIQHEDLKNKLWTNEGEIPEQRYR